jgi:hypothetical protein
MNPDETLALLKARRALTGQVYDDDAVAAWHEALSVWSYDCVRTALIRAARDNTRITVAHIVERLQPPPNTSPRLLKYTCIRCRERPAEPLRTRCRACQAFVDLQGGGDAMHAAVAAAHRKELP